MCPHVPCLCVCPPRKCHKVGRNILCFDVYDAHYVIQVIMSHCLKGFYPQDNHVNTRSVNSLLRYLFCTMDSS